MAASSKKFQVPCSRTGWFRSRDFSECIPKRFGLGTTASVRAEGLEPSAEAQEIIDRWVRGEITAEDMERQLAARYGASE